VCALGVKLIGLKPLFSTGVTTAGVVGVEFEVGAAAGVFVPLKLATLLPKKLPIPLPIPPNVARISGGGLVAVAGDVIGDSDANFSFRIRSASSLSFNLDAMFVRAPSKALKSEDEPVAKADEPAANALLSTSRVGARDWSILRSWIPSGLLARSWNEICLAHLLNAIQDRKPH
jgi:hypothetical protein